MSEMHYYYYYLFIFVILLVLFVSMNNFAEMLFVPSLLDLINPNRMEMIKTNGIKKGVNVGEL